MHGRNNNKCQSPINSLYANKQGATAIVFAVALPMIMIATGCAVDIARAYTVKTRAQAALDSAVLAAASSYDGTAAYQSNGAGIFNANYPSNYQQSQLSEFTIIERDNIDGRQVFDGSVKIKLPLEFMHYLGAKEMNMTVEAQAVRGFGKDDPLQLELSLVLDSTASMYEDNKMNGLKAASTELLDQIFNDNTTLNSVRVSVVPYTTAVNIINYQRNWICQMGIRSPSGYPGNYGVVNYDDPKNYPNFNATLASPISNFIGYYSNTTGNHFIADYLWNTQCGYAANRNNDLPRDIPGAPYYSKGYFEFTDYPGLSSVGMNDIMFRRPRGYIFNYDDASLPNAQFMKNVPAGFSPLTYPSKNYDSSRFGFTNQYNPNVPQGEWKDLPVSPAYPNGPTYGLAPILFASSSKASIQNTINSMQPTGLTRINVGLMWGWFTLSPRWKYQWNPSDGSLPATPNNKLKKIMILMTDGKNTVYEHDNAATNNECYVIKGTALTTDIPPPTNYGIEIYVIGFGKKSELNEVLLSQCASRPDHYFYAADGADLSDIFKDIGRNIALQSIRLTK